MRGQETAGNAATAIGVKTVSEGFLNALNLFYTKHTTIIINIKQF